jgi:hypothetical protein
VVVIFAFTSLAVLDTPAMIALQRRRELALLRLAGATVRQVAAMTAALAFAGAQLPTRLVLRGRAAG